MQKIDVFEYEDLTKEVKEQVFNKTLDEQVEFELDMLQQELDRGEITEAGFYEACGCTKSYAESTSWFVPSCYYDKNKAEVIKATEETLSRCLFTEGGHFIKTK